MAGLIGLAAKRGFSRQPTGLSIHGAATAARTQNASLQHGPDSRAENEAFSPGKSPPPIPAAHENRGSSPRRSPRGSPRGRTPERSPRSSSGRPGGGNDSSWQAHGGGAGADQLWFWEDSEASKETLRKVYQMIDHVGDCSGTISSTELNHMLVNLGEDVGEDMADKMVDLVDEDGSGEIEFEEFYTVLTGKISRDPKRSKRAATLSGRRIRDVRANFDAIDEDNSGFLDKSEVAKLATKMGTALKRRHLIDAMKQMDPTNSGRVTFDMFKNWLVDTRDGRHWTDFLVLPEGAVAAIHEEAAKPRWKMPPVGDETAQWQRLSILLKLMSKAMGFWGCPERMYCQQATKAAKAKALQEKAERAGYKHQSQADAAGIELLENSEDIEMEARARRCFFHPNMPTRTGWDLVQVVLLFYLLLSVPVRIAFERDTEVGGFAFWFDVAVDLYFIVDIGLNFRTPYYNTNGYLEITQKHITHNYLKSWLFIDVIACLPVNYVVLTIDGANADASSGKSIRALKVLRLLKLGKLLRVARLIRMLERYQESLRVFMKAFGGLVLMLGVLLLAHLFGCVWYYVGTDVQLEDLSERTPGALGWVEREFAHGDGCRADGSHIATATTTVDYGPPPSSPPGTNSSSSSSSSISSVGEPGQVMCLVSSFMQRYITAVYWALMTVSTVGYGDIVAKTFNEKITACLSMVFGALLFALISGDMASRFVATKGAVVEFNKRMEEVNQWLTDKNVAIPQQRQIEAHFRLLWGSNLIYDERAILELLPRVIRDPLLGRMYGDMLGGSALFAPLVGGMGIHVGQADATGRQIVNGHEILGKIAMRMTHTVANFGLIIVEEGHYGEDMFFIEDGEVDVYCTGGRLTDKGMATNESGSIDTSLAHWRGQLGTRLGRLGRKAWFAETAVMSRLNDRMRRGTHRRTVVSRSACHFHKLHKSDVDQLRFTYPVLDAMLRRIEKPLDVSDDPMDDQDGDKWRKKEVHISTHKALDMIQRQVNQLEATTAGQHRSLEHKLETAMATIDEMMKLMRQDKLGPPPPAGPSLPMPPLQDDPDG